MFTIFSVICGVFILISVSLVNGSDFCKCPIKTQFIFHNANIITDFFMCVLWYIYSIAVAKVPAGRYDMPERISDVLYKNSSKRFVT